MRIAILGGSFNPVHNGHLALAKVALRDFGYDSVSFVPAYKPPHKDLAYGATDNDRCQMLKAAIKHNSAFVLETCEIDRQGTSYTIDTIQFLEKKYENVLTDKIGLIIGDDLVKDFHLWKNVNELVSKVHVLLACRLDSVTSDSFNMSLDYSLMQNTRLDISSQMIRKRIGAGSEWEPLVPKSVFSYIKKRNLYGVQN